MLNSTYNWVDGVKFTARIIIPDIQPFFKIKLRDMGDKITHWKFHSCNGQGCSGYSRYPRCMGYLHDLEYSRR